MATALTKQVSAYHDAVMHASRLAVACWDMHKPAQEAILMSPGVVASIRAVLSHQSKSNAEERIEWLAVCKEMLRSMAELLRIAAMLREHEFELAGLPEFRAAMTEVRFLMVEILEAGEPAPQKPSANSESPEALEDSLPPQSWYDEEFRALRGPVVK